MKKRQLWLGKADSGERYEIGTGKWSGWDFQYYVQGFCGRDFERITGLKLKLGEVRKIKSIKIELEQP